MPGDMIKFIGIPSWDSGVILDSLAYGHSCEEIFYSLRTRYQYLYDILQKKADGFSRELEINTPEFSELLEISSKYVISKKVEALEKSGQPYKIDFLSRDTLMELKDEYQRRYSELAAYYRQILDQLKNPEDILILI